MMVPMLAIPPRNDDQWLGEAEAGGVCDLLMTLLIFPMVNPLLGESTLDMFENFIGGSLSKI